MKTATAIHRARHGQQLSSTFAAILIITVAATIPHVSTTLICTSTSKTQGNIVTNSKEGFVGTCTFPFTYGGTSYTSCASPSTYGGVGWCAFDTLYIADRWGYCTPGCPGLPLDDDDQGSSLTIEDTAEWKHCVVNPAGCTELSLENRGLTGSIPTSICDFTNLEYVYLQNNRLTGAIPAKLGNCIKLKHLNLHNNKLTDNVPSELGNCVKLTDLRLSNNKLTGTVPTSIWNCVLLTYMELRGNKIEITIEDTLEWRQCVANPQECTRLILNKRGFTGSIPGSIGTLMNLEYFSINENELSGEIPSSVGNCVLLKHLDLHGNKLSGAIPTSISKCILLQYL